MTQDQQDVLALVQKMTSSFEQGDLDTVMQTYETSQTIMFQPGEPVSDPAGARLGFQQFSPFLRSFLFRSRGDRRR